VECVEFEGSNSQVGQSVRNKNRSRVFLAKYKHNPVAVKVLLTPNGRQRLFDRRPSDTAAALFHDRSNDGRSSQHSKDPFQMLLACAALNSNDDVLGQDVSTEPDAKKRGFWDAARALFVHKPIRTSNTNFLKDFRRAMRNMCQLQHNHISTPLGFCLANDHVLIVMDFNHYGSLYDILHNDTFEFNEDMAVEILHDITCGMLFLHKQKPNPVLHGYLSSTNILLDR
jgi:serine/threonine protein kinase